MRGTKIVSVVACFAGALGGALYGCASKFVVDNGDASPLGPSIPDAAPTATTTSTTDPSDGALAPSDGAVDATAPTTRCTTGAPFGTPELLTELSTSAAEPAAALTQDELTIYFSRNGNLMVATRTTRSGPFGGIRSAGLMNGGADDNPALTLDGRQLFFSSDERGDSGASEIFVAQVTDAGLTAPSAVRGIPSDSTDPFPTSDAAALYYSGSRDSGVPDLFFATNFGGTVTEQRLPLSDGQSDGQPVLSRDELSLFYGSRRPGAVGATDIFVATRARTNEAFGNVVSVGAVVNSIGNDLPVWISNDGCVLYFTSDRTGGAGSRDLYRTTRGR